MREKNRREVNDHLDRVDDGIAERVESHSLACGKHDTDRITIRVASVWVLINRELCIEQQSQ